jgi:hypothetical protein
MAGPPEIDWRAFTPEDSPKGLPDVYADTALTDLRTPKVAAGDAAFDIELPVYDFSTGVRRTTGSAMRLSDVAAGRPVALIFGSYT